MRQIFVSFEMFLAVSVIVLVSVGTYNVYDINTSSFVYGAPDSPSAGAAAKFDSSFYDTVQTLVKQESYNDRLRSVVHYYDVVLTVARYDAHGNDISAEQKEIVVEKLNEIGARNIVAGKNLLFVLASIPVGTILDFSLHDEVYGLGDGQIRGNLTINTSRMTVNAEQDDLLEPDGTMLDVSDVIVAVIDSGITHPTVNEAVIGRATCPSNSPCYETDSVYGAPDSGTTHGSMVAHVIGGRNHTSGLGIASGVSLLDAHFIDLNISFLYSALDWAISKGADVANISISYGLCDDGSSTDNLIVNDAVNQGIVITKSAGNYGSFGSIMSPGCASNLLTVGGINDRGTNIVMYGQSSKGPYYSNGHPILKPDIVAPGYKINLVHNDDKTKTRPVTGTSFSSPHVAAAAAMLIGKDETMQANEVKAALLLGANWTGPIPCTSVQYERYTSGDNCSHSRQPNKYSVANGHSSLKILNNVGFGILDVRRSLEYISQEGSSHVIAGNISNGEIIRYAFNITDTAEPVKTLLTWMKHSPAIRDFNTISISDTSYPSNLDLVVICPGIGVMDAGSDYQNNEFAVFMPNQTGTCIVDVTASSIDLHVTSQEYVIASTHPLVPVNIAPIITSIERFDPESEVTSSQSLLFRANFNYPVTGVDLDDFMLSPDSTMESKQFTQTREVLLPIPDEGAAIYDTIAVADSGDILSVSVDVDITHTHIGNLMVDLLAPDGTIVNLHERTGGGSDDINQTYEPAFDGAGLAGDWVLRVRDMSDQEIGTLNEWTLTIEYKESIDAVVGLTGSGSQYFVSVLALRDGTYNLDIVSDSGIIYVAGNPLNGTDLADSDHSYVVETGSPEVVSIKRSDQIIRPANYHSLVFGVNFSEPVRGVDAADFVLSPDDGRALRNFTQTMTPSLPIPDNGAAVFDAVTISSSGTVRSVSVDVDISYTYISDLSVALIAPDGTIALLHNRAGANSHDIHQTYTPNLADISLKGNWTLRMNDAGPADTGTLNEWTLSIKYDEADSTLTGSGSRYLVTVPAAQSGTYNLDIVPNNGISDLAGNPLAGDDPPVDQSFQVEITDYVPITVDAGLDQTVMGGQMVALNGTAAAIDGDPLTYLWTHNSTLAIQFTNSTSPSTTFTAPYVSSNTTLTLTLTADDGTAEVSDSVDILIMSTQNVHPVLDVIQEQAVDEMSPLIFVARATDEDLPSDTLTYGLEDPPAGASMDPATGAFTWTPTEDQNGIHTITVTVSDGNGGTDSQDVKVTVNEVNMPPTLDVIPAQTIDELAMLTFTVNASDDDLHPGVGIEVVAGKLKIPWSIDWTPDWTALFTERGGDLRIIRDGILLPDPIFSVDVIDDAEGGLLGIAVDPEFEENQYIYMYQTYKTDGTTLNKVVRYTLANVTVSEDLVLVDGIPGASYHDGGRIQFGPDGNLYITTGDAGNPSLAQDLDSLAGKILRITREGAIPQDNPFSNSAVWSWGHRNPQGMDWDGSGNLIATEHGPSGERGEAHDEINLILPGANYGWPETVGDESMAGMQDPLLHTGSETWAPSGSEFYDGDMIPGWTGKYFVANLLGEHLRMIDLDLSNNGTHSHEGLFEGQFGRLRDVQTGPDGFLYLLTSNRDGRGSPVSDDDRILKIVPVFDSALSRPANVLTYGLEASPAGASMDPATGTFTWRPAEDQNGIHTITVTVSDGNGGTNSQEVQVTVNVVNVAPIVDAGSDQTALEGQTVMLNGTATDADGDSLTYLWSHNSSLAIQLANSTSPSTIFAVPAVDADTAVTFTLTVDDGTTTATDSFEVTVTDIQILNSPPVADAGSDQTALEGQTVMLNGTATDADGDSLTYLWSHNSSLAIQLANSTSPSTTFTVPAVDADTEITFTLTVDDGIGISSDQVTITIDHNDLPTVKAGADQTVQEGQTVMLNGTAADNDGDQLTYRWSHDSTLPIVFANDASLSTTFAAPAVDADTEITFTLTVDDGIGISSDQVTITIDHNDLPTVKAGADQTVQEGQTVVLNGTAADNDGDQLTYRWSHDSTLPIVFANDASLSTTFAAPAVDADTEITFTLTVDDGIGISSDQVTITIDHNDLPTVKAGADQTVQEGQTVVLNGTAADNDGDQLTYRWSHDSTLPIVFANDASLSTTFAAPAVDADTEITFTLTVDDGIGISSDQVTITIDHNDLPTVKAGADQIVQEGQTVMLNGTAADNDGDQLTYRWSHDSTLPIVFANDASLSTTFAAPAVDADTEITFTLTVDDGIGISSDQVTITIDHNDLPTVKAGADQTVQEGQTVMLNGTAADNDGDQLTYRWSHDSTLPIVFANDASLSTTFAAPAVDADTEITFTLTVDDGIGISSDQVTITIDHNDLPTVKAGADQTVQEGQTVMLNGTAADNDGDQLTYRWSHDSTLPIVFANDASLSTTFAAPAVDADTEITFTLTVDDGIGISSDQVTITIDHNDLPTVKAGADQTVQEGQTVMLNGTAADNDGDQLTYRWSHDSTLPIVFANDASLSTTFAAPAVDADTEITFTLTVDDGLTDSTDTVLVTVNDVPDDSDFVTTWETMQQGESITIPARGTYTIDWGDGTVDARVTGDQTHTYADPGNHTVRISEGITGIYLNNHADAPNLRSIDQWGDAEWRSMYSSFMGASNMVLHATDAPDLSRVTNTSYMFLNASSFDGDLSAWDLSHVTSMTGMFWGASSFDGDLSGWDVSAVTNMNRMFSGASSFNGDISGWDVSAVTNMNRMFSGASSFNGDISGWDVSAVTNMNRMFSGASSFNGDISGWDVSSVTDMSYMFLDSPFNGNLGEWYIMLDNASVTGILQTVGNITTQNEFLATQGPTYGIGSSSDSEHFGINGTALVLTTIPDANPALVNITSTGDFGTSNSRIFEITFSSGVVDITNPRLASIERSSPASQNTDSQSLIYKATFSESVTGVTSSDFILSPDSTGGGTTTISAEQFTQTRSPNLVIPDDTTVSDTITVSDSGTATSVSVAVDITHTYIGDLKIDLIAPDGTTRTLHNRSGGSADDIDQTYAPSFGSIPISGVWTLRINDNYNTDPGTLNSWTLTINHGSTATTVNPVTGVSGSGDTYYVTVSSTVDGTYNLDLVSSGHGIADSASNPLTNTVSTGADETYIVSTTAIDITNPRLASIERSSPTSQNTDSQSLIYEVTFSESVTGVTSSDFILSPDSTGGGTTTTSAEQFTQTRSPNLAIPDDTTVSDTITVSDSGTATSVSVAVDITHTYIGDLKIDLIAPDGTTRTLHNRSGGSADDIDQTYAPSFGSIPISGVWTLRINDNYNADPGTLNSWTLTINHGSTATTVNPVTGVSGSGDTYYVTVSSTVDGTYNLDLVSSGHGIADSASNPLTNTVSTGADETYIVSTTAIDITNPRLASIERSSPTSQNTDSQSLIYKATFSESVTGVTSSDFILSPDSTGGGTTTTSAEQFTQTRSPNLVIPDDTTVSDTITVSDSGTATSVSVAVDITHTYIGDLKIDLIAPDGTTRTLHNRSGGSADDIDQTYAPSFGSIPISGVWTLRINDNYNTDPGTLNSWTLTINHGSTATTVNPVTGVSGSGDTYYVTVSSTVDGTYNLDLVSSGHGIADSASNPLTNTVSTGADETYIVSTTAIDITNPRLASIERSSPTSQNTDSQSLIYKATFSESVTGVTSSDFILSPDSTGGGTTTSAEQFTQTRSPNLAIPDDTTVSDTITVSDSGTATSVSVAVDITHTYIGDLKIDLIAPDGTTRTLHNRSGGSADDIDQTYAPSFGSIPISGVWTLRINDNYNADPGTLNSWTLTINHGSTATTVNPVTGVSGSGDTYYVTVSSTVDGTYNLDLVSSGHGIADSASNPLTNTVSTGADETYIVSTTAIDITNPRLASIERSSPTSQNTDSQSLIYEVTFSESVTGVTSSDFILSPDSTGGGTTTTSAEQFTQTRSPNLAIPDDTTVSDTITVSDSGTATSVSVAVDITHTYIGDLKIDLIAPDGTTRTLHNRSGGSADDIDQTYAPSFGSIPISGVWTLRINDNYNADPGTLNSWTLTINHGSTATTVNPVTGVSGSGDTYYVTVSSTVDGTYNLDLVSSGHGIADSASNPLTNTVSTGADETYIVSTTAIDITNPRLASIERSSPTSQNTDSQSLIYEVTFSESVTGVTSSDFILSPDSTGGGTTTTSAEQFTQTRSPNLAIPDDTTVSDTITVSDSGTATSVSVAVDITHTYIGDLKIDLIAPDGTTRTLHNRSGGSADDIDQTYAPSFGSIPISGVWTLRINDNYNTDPGTLNSWTLTINHGSTATTVNPVTGVSGSGDTYYVTVSSTVDGTYNLDLVSSGHGIADSASNPLTNTVSTGADETYIVSTTAIDITNPRLASIERSSPTSQNTDSQSLIYKATFSESVTGVTSSDFILSPDSTGGGTTTTSTEQFTQTRSPNLAIPDDTTVSDTITVSDSGTATSVSVAVDITHTYIGDLKIDLIAPDGTTRTLHNRSGGSADDIDQTYAPSFGSIPISGVWTLRINDNYNTDPGTLNSWTLTINHGSTATTVNPVTGVSGSGDTYYVTVSSTVDGTYNLDLVSSGHGIADSASNPLTNTVSTGADETYIVSTTAIDITNPRLASIERSSPTSQNTDSQSLIYEVTFSESVTGVTSSDFILSPDSTGGGTTTTSAEQFTQTRSPNLAIPDDTTVSDTITVSDSGTATSVSVAVDITHTYIGDLKIDLIAPDGTTRTLHNRSGGSADDIDQTYAPSFGSIPISGVWTLRINDNYNADPGTLNSWTLTINHGSTATTVNPVTGVSGSGDTYYVTVSSTVDGTYNLDLVSSGHGIADSASNPLTNTVSTGADETYIVSTTAIDITNPRLASIERSSPTSQNTDSQSLIYEVTFSESVTGVTSSDFILSPDSTGGGTTTTSAEQFTQTRSPNLAIPDDTTVSDTITVSDSGTATSVSVAVDITHTYIGDLKIDLIAPDGTTRTLHNRSGGSADDIDQTYAPSFGSIPISGVWTLRINDNYNADPGTLNSWTLTINHGSTATTVNPVTGVSGSGDTYYVTVSSTVDGTYNLDLIENSGIKDNADNPMTNTVATGTDQTYTVIAN